MNTIYLTSDIAEADGIQRFAACRVYSFCSKIEVVVLL